MTTSADPVRTVAKYVAALTGKGLGIYHTSLRSGPGRLTVFRRPSCLRTDETTITRERLMRDVTAKVQSSAVNGFLVGDVAVREDGSIARRLGRHREALLDYLLREVL